MFLLVATHTGSSLITGLLTAITPERLWGTYGSSALLLPISDSEATTKLLGPRIHSRNAMTTMIITTTRRNASSKKISFSCIAYIVHDKVAKRDGYKVD